MSLTASASAILGFKNGIPKELCREVDLVLVNRVNKLVSLVGVTAKKKAALRQHNGDLYNRWRACSAESVLGFIEDYQRHQRHFTLNSESSHRIDVVKQAMLTEFDCLYQFLCGQSVLSRSSKLSDRSDYLLHLEITDGREATHSASDGYETVVSYGPASNPPVSKAFAPFIWGNKTLVQFINHQHSTGSTDDSQSGFSQRMPPAFTASEKLTVSENHKTVPLTIVAFTLIEWKMMNSSPVCLRWNLLVVDQPDKMQNTRAAFVSKRFAGAVLRQSLDHCFSPVKVAVRFWLSSSTVNELSQQLVDVRAGEQAGHQDTDRFYLNHQHQHQKERQSNQRPFNQLTKLPDRNALLKYLGLLLQHWQPAPQRSVEQEPMLLHIHLQRLTHVNNGRDEQSSERLLATQSHRLYCWLAGVFDGQKEADGFFLTTLNHQELALVIEDMTRLSDIAQFAQHIRLLLSQPVQLDGDVASSYAVSIGIASLTEAMLAREDQTIEPAEQFLNSAAVALWTAVEEETGVHFFKANMTSVIDERLSLSSQLYFLLRTQLAQLSEQSEYYWQGFHGAGLSNFDIQQFDQVNFPLVATDPTKAGYLDMHFQPQINLHNQQIVGFEALIRWQHPVYGLLLPDRFLPLVEQLGLLPQLDQLALQLSIKKCQQLNSLGFKNYRVAVNLTEPTISRGHLADSITDLLKSNGVAANQLELEITEGVLLKPTETVLDTLSELKALGVTLTLDDFGTGYSSLAYINDYQVQKIKIDRSFIQGIEDKRQSRLITDHIIQLATELDLEVVAEGVETQSQLDYLKRRGCHSCQGFFFSRPVSIEQLVATERSMPTN